MNRKRDKPKPIVITESAEELHAIMARCAAPELPPIDAQDLPPDLQALIAELSQDPADRREAPPGPRQRAALAERRGSSASRGPDDSQGPANGRESPVNRPFDRADRPARKTRR